MRRTRAYRRFKNYTKAKRKRDLDLQVSYYFNEDGTGLYKNLHQYSKNKIHCSCPMCSAKTRNKGKRRTTIANYSPSINYSIADKRKYDAMTDDIKENTC